MKSDKQTRNHALVILFCLISMLTALDHGNRVGAATPQAGNQTLADSERLPDLHGMSWMHSGLIPDDSENTFSASLRPDLENASASELLIGPNSGLLRRTADTTTSEFNTAAPLPVLMARVNGSPLGSNVGAPPASAPIIGGGAGSGCTPEQKADPNSLCYQGGTPTTPEDPTAPPAAVPEPSSIAFIGFGLGLFAIKAFSRR